MTLLAVLLLVGLIFLIMNVGDHVNRRIATQNAADAAAMSAAVQMARGMNAVAMNNIATSRMLSAIMTLDGLERTVDASLNQAEAFWPRMVEQAADAGPAGPLRTATAEALMTIRDALANERALLIEYAPQVLALDLHSYTTYDIAGDTRPLPHGGFWAAAADLDRFSEATVQFAGLGAQANAATYARQSRAREGMVLPILPVLQARRGEWRDWNRNPGRRDSLLMNGWIPDLDFPPSEEYDLAETRDLLVSPGPFWKLFRWRTSHRVGSYDLAGGVRFLGSHGFGSHPGDTTDTRAIRDYRTYGPASWMHGVLYNYWWANLHYSMPHYRGGTILRGLQDAVRRYMFNPHAGDRMLHDPEWEAEYVTARSRAAGGDSVELTAHFRLEVVGPYGADDARIASIARDPDHSNWHDPLLLLENGWRDRSSTNARAALVVSLLIRPTRFPEDTPESPEIPDEFVIQVVSRPTQAWTKITNHIWEVTFSPDDFESYLTSRYPTSVLWSMIRSRLQLPDGYPPFEFTYTVETEIPHVTYRDIFAGADFGSDTLVHNPANFPMSIYPDGLPVPYMLDLPDRPGAVYEADHDEGFRREHLTFLGIARNGSQADVWRYPFVSRSPGGVMMAMAQAEVFNPTSFDLWTQDWRAQLVPVTKVDQWADTMADQQYMYGDVRLISTSAALMEDEDLDVVGTFLDALGVEPADTEQVILH